MVLPAVFIGMTRPLHLDQPGTARPGVRVRAPQAGDAIGEALRDAFGCRHPSLPDDMSALLRRIDGGTINRAG